MCACLLVQQAEKVQQTSVNFGKKKIGKRESFILRYNLIVVVGWQMKTQCETKSKKKQLNDKNNRQALSCA